MLFLRFHRHRHLATHLYDQADSPRRSRHVRQSWQRQSRLSWTAWDAAAKRGRVRGKGSTRGEEMLMYVCQQLFPVLPGFLNGKNWKNQKHSTALQCQCSVETKDIRTRKNIWCLCEGVKVYSVYTNICIKIYLCHRGCVHVNLCHHFTKWSSFGGCRPSILGHNFLPDHTATEQNYR